MPSAKDSEGAELLFTNAYKDFQSSIKHPEAFLSAQPKKEEKLKKVTKCLYDLSVSLHDSAQISPNVLPELILDSMDEEQIWQQLELRNNQMMTKFLAEMSRLLSLNKNALSFKCRLAGDGDSQNDLEVTSELEEDVDDELQDEDEEYDSGSLHEEKSPPKKQSREKKQKKSGRKSVVDDQFFKLSEMEEFLKAEDEKEMRKQKSKPGRSEEDVEEIDYFKSEESEEDDEEEEDFKYGDFFDGDEEEASGEEQSPAKSRKRRRDEEEDEDEEEQEDEEQEELVGEEEEDDQSEVNDEDVDEPPEEDDGDDDDSEQDDNKDAKPKSSFEERQDRLRQRIKEQEEAVLGEKPWQLKGEITATGRPQNSLLEEILEFDSTTRPAPVITEETTLRLEDIIRQRIKDKAWDDVERKYKPVQTPQELRKKLVLDQEKSKESLAQIYEKEYRNQMEKLNPNEADGNDEEPESHKEIRKLMKSLFVKLDALSNFHYTPKPAVPEVRIVTNTPAVEVEEVAPVAVSTAKLLAPEEVRAHAKGDVLGKTERTRTDKNRERRKKKIKQKLMAKAAEEKLQAKQKAGQSLSNKEEKKKLLKSVMKHRNVQQMTTSTTDTGAIKSSKAFFSQLQDAVSTGKDAKVKKKAPKEQVSAKRLKL
ncbi:unnamed protein product [Hermetia illucens]|uniref:U3 small nucleolar ribonucleoprotein protein MPP10 n=1 Tax=Hermetia illucens TaxID=343691 RepID=A0A7R8USH9_HERIL|nr:U3 small nucleolar ribonucleoprotein protein MPP10 [Hermetia illucens]CAD7086156.1 unnamed protein product [Hermetia illucens]